MINLLSTCLVFLQAVSGFGLPWSTAEPDMISPCTTKFVIVDDAAKKSDDLTIPYEICKVKNLRNTCFVSNNPKQLCDGDPIQQLQVETIQEAQFVDMNGKVNNISHDRQHFNVSLKGEDFTIGGIYNYSVSYYYKTRCYYEDIVPEPTSCFGRTNLSLIIVVTDVRLTVVSNHVLMLENKEDMTQQTFQAKEDGSIVNLECTLGLTSLQDRELFNMRLKFEFTSHSNGEKTVWCNESNQPQMVDNWVVTSNMNDGTCHLKIMNFSEADSGQYNCLMVLISSHTSYNQDRSNAVILAAENTLKASKKQNTNKNDLGHLEDGLFYVIVSLMVVTVLPCSVILIVAVIMKVRKKHREPNPDHPRPPAPNPVLAYSYGSIGITQCHRGTDGGVIDLGPDTPYHSEPENIEVESSFQSGNDTDSSPKRKQPTTDSPVPSSSSDESIWKSKSSRKRSSTRLSHPRSSRTRSSLPRPLRPRSSYTKSSRRRKQKVSRKSGAMSEIINDKSDMALEYKNMVSARIASSLDLCTYNLVGYKLYEEGTCDSGSRLSLPDISQVHPLKEQDQAEGGDTVAMYRPIPSDTNSTGPATSESSPGPSSSDLSSGETSSESHYQLEQRGDS